MSKWVILSGLVVAFVVVNQIHEESLTLVDVFDVVEVRNELKTPAEVVAEVESVVKEYLPTYLAYGRIAERAYATADSVRYPSRVYGAIVPSNIKSSVAIAVFFDSLAKTQSVETFVVVGRNSDSVGDYEIAISSQGYSSLFGNLDIDDEFAGILLESGDSVLDIGRTLLPFKGERSILISSLFIKKSFPEAKIVPILLKDDVSYDDLDVLADVIEREAYGKTVVLAVGGFSQQMDERVAAFHDELGRNVIESFDIEGLKNTEVESKKALYTLMSYSSEAGAKKAGVQAHYWDQNSEMIVTFRRGSAVGDRSLHVMAFGDIMLGRYVRTLMDENGAKDYVFDKIKGFEGRFFRGADVVHGNLEGPIKGAGKKGGTAMSFAFNVDVAEFLKKYHFNVLSIANNHAVDQGWGGRDSTIAAFNAAGLGWCGHPSEADGNSVYYGEAGEKKYAFVCLHDVTFKLDDTAALKLIREVRKKVDFLLISIHWGYEYKQRADWSSQIEPGRAFIDAGADFVIGHHPHVVQNFEIYKGKPIFYSLGNFVFDQYWSEMTQEELGLGIVLNGGSGGSDGVGGGGGGKVYLFPMRSERSQSRLMQGEELQKWLENYLLYGDYTEDMRKMILSWVVEF